MPNSIARVLLAPPSPRPPDSLARVDVGERVTGAAVRDERDSGAAGGVGDAMFRAFVEQSPDIVLLLARDGTLAYASPSLRAMLGDVRVGVGRSALRDFVHPEDVPAAERLAADAVASSAAPVLRVLRLQASDGEWVHVELIARDLVGEPAVGGVLVHGRDVTARVRVEQRLHYEALHDPLTGLANQVLFRDRISEALAETGAGDGEVALILLDLDQFKGINDSLGHAQGDEFLRAVAGRLLSATRGSDTVARLGGDEYGILLTGLYGKDDVKPVLDRIEAALRKPVRLAGRDVTRSGSLGVTMATGARTVDEILREGDLAMYAAKADGGGRHRFFEQEMHVAVLDRVQLEADLRAAVENGEIELAFQPLVDLDTGRTYGMEALARWTHPERGPIAPARFIPIAEETGIIVTLGRRALREACTLAAAWQRHRAGEPPLLMSVNLSGRQLLDGRVVEDVASALAETGLAPGSLILEITESTLVRNTDVVLARLSALKALGVQLAIDDFGTGYSSLAYLRSFPIDILKIDRRFVEDLGSGGSSSGLARAVLSLGATLGLRTVAEGVETQSQLTELRSLGCQFGQGYLFARPLSADEAERHLRLPPSDTR